MHKLAIISTHPIQYNAPLFAMLHTRRKLQVKVFYTWGKTVLEKKFDPGFNKDIEWDIDLLKGYDYEFAINTSKDKGSHHFNGIDTPYLIEDIKAWGADAVLVYGWSFKSHLSVLRYFKKRIPVFFRGDSTSLNSGKGFKRMFRKILLSWVYSHVDVCFFVGTNNKHYFLENGVKENRLIFAPHAIDNDRFRLVSQDKKLTDAWRMSLHIKENDIVFLYTGKLDSNKNTDLLIQAFMDANVKYTQLVIAGSGEKENELKSKYAQHANIHFLPFQNQSKMPLLYGMADVYVLPSIAETWGLAINEAMACGKAVIASDSCGAAIDIIIPGENGYVFKKNDRSDLAAKIALLSKDSGRVRLMGKASSQIIDKWTYQHCCDAIESAMKNLSEK